MQDLLQMFDKHPGAIAAVTTFASGALALIQLNTRLAIARLEKWMLEEFVRREDCTGNCSPVVIKRRNH